MQFPTLIRQNLRRPIIAVTIHGPHGLSLQTDALIDTGSDVTLFAIDVARRLKIDLTGVPSLSVITAVGPVATYQPYDLILDIRRPPDVLRWTARAGFLPRPMSLGILGTKGFFEFFDLNYSAHDPESRSPLQWSGNRGLRRDECHVRRPRSARVSRPLLLTSSLFANR